MSLTRRKFIALSAVSGTAGMLLNTLDTFAKPAEQTKAAAGFGLMIFATNWGYEGSWDQFCAKIRTLGYDGAEAWYPTDDVVRKEFLAAFQRHNLKFGFLVGGSDRDYQKHLQQFSTSLEGAVAFFGRAK
jgi:hypothetical protein